MHELLPWYANGTLERSERARFEEHLAVCPDCERELELVGQLRSELEQAGSEGVWDHPSPRLLAAVVAPETASMDVEEEQARDLRRHLSVCLTCAEEAGWLRGETVASGTVRPRAGPAMSGMAAARRPTREWVAWAGLAAAMILLAIATPLALRPGVRTGTGTGAVVASTQRADERQTVEVAPGPSQVTLLFEVDLGREDSPARMVVSREGKEIYAGTLEPDDLLRGLFVVFHCRRADCPDGQYEARITTVRPGRAPIEYHFRLQSTRPLPKPAP